MKNKSNRFVKLNSFAALGLSLLLSAPIFAYDYSDNQPYSQQPPQNLAPNKVPMLVSIGFDDNGISGLSGSGGTGGMTWFLDFIRDIKNPSGFGNAATFDGTPVRVTFFNSAKYQEQWIYEDPIYVKRAWHTALTDGHEIGNHTVNHDHGEGFTLSEWESEIRKTQESLSKPFDNNELPGNSNPDIGMGADISKLTGFRTPFLEYSNGTFEVLTDNGIVYDTSIEEGSSDDAINGANFPWPYTLDNGSIKDSSISSHPGLWELGVTPLIIPPELRAKVKANVPSFNEETGKFTAFDYNIWAFAKLNKADTLRTLKYTLDLRLQNGNRAPFMLGAHTDYFSSKKANEFSQISVRERQEVIEEFITYALTKSEVRIVPFKSIVNWMRAPSTLECQVNCGDTPSNDPWVAIDALGQSINDLQEHNDTLALTLFSGTTWQQQLAARELISTSLSEAASKAWNGKPRLAISKLNQVIGYINQKMLLGTLRASHKQKIYSYISQLNLLVGEFTETPTTDENPWDIADDLGGKINALQEHSDTLALTLFTGSTWQQQLAAKDLISVDLSKAASESWNGKPRLAISTLNQVQGYLDQKMLSGSERTSHKQQIDGFITQLNLIVGAEF